MLAGENEKQQEELISARMRKLVAEWARTGVLDGKNAARVNRDLDRRHPRGDEAASAKPKGARRPGPQKPQPIVITDEKKPKEDDRAAMLALAAELQSAKAAAPPPGETPKKEEPPPAVAKIDTTAPAPSTATPESAKGIEVAASATKEAKPDRDEDEDKDGRDDDARGSHLDHAASTGRKLFRGGGETDALTGGLETFASLDEKPASARSHPAWAMAREQVWWLIGMLLVLGGSIMGVREAWRTLAGPSRPILVAAALFIYHLGFVGLANLLGRRVALVGKVLATLAVTLLPMVFVALAALIDQAPLLGMAVAAPFVGFGGLSLRSISKHYAAPQLSLLVLPALVAELPLSRLAVDSPWRALLPLCGVATVALAVLRPQQEDRPGIGARLAVTLYTTLSLMIFAIVGAPDLSGGALAPVTLSSVGQMSVALWLASLGGVLVEAMALPALRKRLSFFAGVIEVGMLGFIGCVALAVTFTLPATTLREPLLGLLGLAAMGIATAVYARAELRHPAAIHIGIPVATLTTALVARLLSPLQPAWWCFGAALTPAILLVRLRGSQQKKGMASRLVWGVLLSMISIAAAAQFESATAPAATALLATAATAALIATAAHLAAQKSRPLHYLGGLATLIMVLAYFMPLRPLLLGWPDATASTAVLPATLLGAGLFYGVVAIFAPHSRDELSPFDDLSLACAVLAAVILGASLPPAAAFVLSPQHSLAALSGRLPAYELALAASILLSLRSLRDRSRIVGALSVAMLSLIALAASGATSSAQLALGCAALSLGLGLLANLRGKAPDSRTLAGRPLCGVLPLPWPARPMRLLADSAALGSWLTAIVAVGLLVTWLSQRNEPDRAFAIPAGMLLVVTMLLGFFTRSYGWINARGSVVLLGLAGAVIALTAVVNRIGRPLPPDIVGRNLTGILFLVWLAARGLHRIGPRLAEWLSKTADSDGKHYHLVPHAGVLALGLLLGYDTFVVDHSEVARALVIVPPLLPFGAALAAALLARSSHQAAWLFCGLPFLLMAGALGAAQGHVNVGATEMSQLGNGAWVLSRMVPLVTQYAASDARQYLLPGDTVAAMWIRATQGLAVATVILALLGFAQSRAIGRRIGILLLDNQEEEDRAEQDAHLKTLWALYCALAALVVLGDGLIQPRLPAALCIAASGALLLRSDARALGVALLAGSAFLVVHTLAQLAARVPSWPGPVLALLGLVAVAIEPWLHKKDAANSPLRRLLFFWEAGALSYALATGGATDPNLAGPTVLIAMLGGVAGTWVRFFALSTGTAIVAVTLAVLAIRDDRAGRAGAAGLAFYATLLLGVAGLTTPAPFTGARFVELGLHLGLMTALAAAMAHIAARQLAAERPALLPGFGNGRDTLIIVTGLCIALQLRGGRFVPELSPLYVGLAAIGLAAALALDVAFRERTPRHVYMVQVSVVGIYALLRVLFLPELGPQADAVFALLLGFVLVGVTVIARRSGIPPVAAATRRFAALLPVAIGLLFVRQATVSAALLAAASSLLYTLLGVAERSKALGALGAVAANLALLLIALASGLRSTEIYFAPLGLLVMMLARIFAATIEPGARRMLQVLGGLILYVPAALSLTQQLGQDTSGGYSLIFGAVCLLGVAIGVAVHIRAYLVLGVLFLLLDLVSNLLYIGLRDHRIGFFVLSLAGLSIIGSRALVTLRPEIFQRRIAWLRKRLRSWD